MPESWERVAGKQPIGHESNPFRGANPNVLRASQLDRMRICHESDGLCPFASFEQLRRGVLAPVTLLLASQAGLRSQFTYVCSHIIDSWGVSLAGGCDGGEMCVGRLVCDGMCPCGVRRGRSGKDRRKTRACGVVNNGAGVGCPVWRTCGCLCGCDLDELGECSGVDGDCGGACRWERDGPWEEDRSQSRGCRNPHH